jgi:beta-ureidopropionase
MNQPPGRGSGRHVRCALVQTSAVVDLSQLLRKQLRLIEQAADAGAQIVALQELATTPYFCQEKDPRWFDCAEPVAGGRSVEEVRRLCASRSVVVVLPLFEVFEGRYYNSAVVIDADGKILGTYRKIHIPDGEHFWEKFYFQPGDLGFPVFDTRYGRVGVYICYDRHFPEGARIYGLQGVEILFIPTAAAGRSEVMWPIESAAHAIANGYYVGSVNRIGRELNPDLEFFGTSYFSDPWGKVIATGARDREDIVFADLDLSQVGTAFDFLRDRRADVYAATDIQLQ